MSSVRPSTSHVAQRCTAPRQLLRRLQGAFRRLQGGLLCALLVALVLGLAPLGRAPAAHAGTTISTSDWMADLAPQCAANPNGACEQFANLTLTQIAIPGTHDTGTYSIPVTPTGCAPHVWAPDFAGTVAAAEALNGTINCPATMYALAALTFGIGPTAIISGFVAALVVLAATAAATPGTTIAADLAVLGGNAFGPGIAPVFSPFTRSQDRTITQMLDDGIRYLDLRLCGSSDGVIRICHSLYGTTAQDIIDQVNTWTAAHPKEVVIMDFNHFYAMSQEDQTTLATTIINTFGTRLVPPDDPGDITLQLLWQRHQNVIVSYQDGQLHPQTNPVLWPSSLPSTTHPPLGANAFPLLWGATYDVPTMDSKAQNALRSHCKLTCPDSFFIYFLQLTPGMDDILKGILPTSADSLQDAAARSNPVVITGFFHALQSGTVPLGNVNIVAVDFYEHTDLVQDCINLDKSI
jgi:hypothetical protein